MRDVSIPDLGAIAAIAAMQRAGVAPEDIDELAMGVNLPGSDRSIARQTALRAGIPDTVTAYTVDRACCSSLTALSMVRRAVLTGDATIAIAGGGENLSRVPYFLDGMRFGKKLGNIVLEDQLVISCPYTGVPRAMQASDEGALHGIDRAAQDEWALRSHERAAAAQRDGLFDDEITPVAFDGDAKLLDHDESIRPDTTLERLLRLPAVNGSATVTAGNAPGLSTGASFAVVASAERARTEGRPVLAEVICVAQAAGHPAKIGSIPAVAARTALRRAGLTLDDMDLIEINEAFAVVPLVATLVLAEGDEAAANKLRERTNVNGGAIALGHPTGATGLRLIMTAAGELRRRGGGRALITMCGGVGEGEAAVIEVAGSSR
ncbi:MAG: acetyl-CoA C-acetyltransferase [Ilumatobacteraceae bacterium]|jgi:acetyl-CoA C-acetyltransferase